MKSIRTDRTVISLAFSADGSSLVSGGWRHVAFWDVHTGACSEVEQEDCLQAHAVTFSADGAHVIWVCRTETGNRTELRSVGSPQISVAKSRALRRDSQPEIASLPDGNVLVVGSGICDCFRPGSLTPAPSPVRPTPARPVSIWQSPAGPVPVQHPGKSPISAFGVVPDGTLLARRDVGRLTVLRVGNAGQVFAESVPGLEGIAFTPDGRLLIACAHCCVRIWETSRWSEYGRFDWEIGSPVCVAVSPDGLTAAASGYAGDIIIWDLD